MLVAKLFEHINNAYRGTDDDAPTAGTNTYTEWLNTANRKLHEYYTDEKVSRRSLFIPDTSVGTVTSAQTYDLPTNFLNASDEVIVTLSGNDTKFQVVEPQERTTGTVYISGSNPQTLTFYDDLTQLVGGTITVPGYFEPDELVDDSSYVYCDDPYWLVYAVASSLAFNDLTYESKFPDLNNMANSLWGQMLSNNRRGTSGNPRTVRYNVDRIPGSTR